MIKRLVGVLTAVLLALQALVMAAGTATAAPPPGGLCQGADPARPVIRQLPWAQHMLDPARAWQYTTGAGVLVAVVDSGVDSDHPQLRSRGKVLAGEDFFQVGKLPANFDCDSHGTAVAGIIAADQVAGIGFSGVAPGARILPVRIAERAATDDGTSNQIDPQVLAQGIRYAVDRGAKVINLSLSGQRDDRVVRDAISYARSRDALIVAAVGNGQRDGQPLPSYPAAFDGVLGVGAIDIAGQRLSASQVGPYVDLTAPGVGVVGPTRRAGHTYLSGTSFAAPFVAGTAALVRAAWPNLTAAQVAQRILATATPARGGSERTAYGAGVVDPYRAVTEGLTGAKPRPAAPMQRPAPDSATIAAHAAWHRSLSNAWSWAAVALTIALLLLAAAIVIPRGRRQRWSAVRAGSLPGDRPRDEPPEHLYLIPPPPAER